MRTSSVRRQALQKRVERRPGPPSYTSQCRALSCHVKIFPLLRRPLLDRMFQLFNHTQRTIVAIDVWQPEGTK